MSNKPQKMVRNPCLDEPREFVWDSCLDEPMQSKPKAIRSMVNAKYKGNTKIYELKCSGGLIK